MTQQFHFWVYIQKNCKQDLKVLFAHPFHNSIIHNSQKVETTQCPSTDKWINKMSYIHTMEYYSALKRKKILSHSTTQMNFEDIMLNEISQPQNGKYCTIKCI